MDCYQQSQLEHGSDWYEWCNCQCGVIIQSQQNNRDGDGDEEGGSE